MNKTFLNKTLMYQYDKELASAFQVDCEEFLDEFEKLHSFSFTNFQKIWHQTKFTYVFAGQKYALLLRDFCDNCFYIVKKYIMFPRSMFTQIGAFYLLYGLYYRQPVKGFVKIRLTLEEYSKIYELIEEMRNRNQMEAVYIFSKMRAEGVFLYVAQRKPLGPEDRFVKGVELYINDTFTASKTQSALVKFKDLQKSLDFVSNFEKTNNEYNELQKKLAGKYPTLTQFSSNLSQDIQNTFDTFNSTEQHSESTASTDTKKRVIEKAVSNKNAVYRGSRKVKTALDDDSESSED